MINTNDKQDSIWDFCTKWRNKGIEDSDDRIFWIDILQQVLGATNATKRIVFQKKVFVNGRAKKIDAYIPETKILIEQKSYGVFLDKKILQSDGIYLTPYEQAKRYNDNLPLSEKAKWIITSNFAEFWIYDMDTAIPESSVVKLHIVDLIKNNLLLNFILTKNASKTEASVNNQFENLDDEIIMSHEFARALLYNQTLEPWTIITQRMLVIILAEIDQEWHRTKNDNTILLSNTKIAEQMNWDLDRKVVIRVIRQIMNILLTKNITISNYTGPLLLKFFIKNNITYIEINPEFMSHLLLEPLTILNKSFFTLYKSDVLNFRAKGSFLLYLDFCCSAKINKGINIRLIKLENLKKLLGIKKDGYIRIRKKEKKATTVEIFDKYSFEKNSLLVVLSEINNTKKIKLKPYEDENLFKTNRAVKSVFEYEFKYIITN